MKPATAIITLLLLVTFLQPGTAFAQADAARVGVFAPLTIAPGALVEIPIQVENVTDLYGIDFELRFDPAVLEAQDADPAMAGIQLGFGEFLEPGLLLYNTVDNETGIVHVVMTQVNPAEPKSGSGYLFVLYVKGLQEGTTDLEVTNLQLASREGLEIPSTAANSSVTVQAGAPDVVATSIPVVNPTSVILIPTLAPTPTATVQPTATRPMATQAVQPTQPGEPIPTEASVEPGGGFSLLKNWWIVALALAGAAGLAVYFFRSRRTS
ncbi:MAG TPA: cohesin domain-containing protein [Anaerolineaceae bacterium]|nr:cohesin domain-containing protein [Anaerolineaceae bacterium]